MTGITERIADKLHGASALVVMALLLEASLTFGGPPGYFRLKTLLLLYFPGFAAGGGPARHPAQPLQLGHRLMSHSLLFN